MEYNYFIYEITKGDKIIKMSGPRYVELLNEVNEFVEYRLNQFLQNK